MVSTSRCPVSETRARSRHWNEEGQLLKEEMQRVLAYFEYNAAC